MWPLRARPSRLDLDEGDRGSVERDDVDLALAGAVVAVEDREAQGFQVGDSKVLAEAPEGAARILWTLGRRAGVARCWGIEVGDACKACSALGTGDADGDLGSRV
jgi:hypothetical protein